MNGRFLPSTSSAADLQRSKHFKTDCSFSNYHSTHMTGILFPQQLGVPSLKVRAVYTKIVIIQFLMASFYHFHVASFIITMCKYILTAIFFKCSSTSISRDIETHFSSFIHALYSSPCTGSNLSSRFYLFI